MKPSSRCEIHGEGIDIHRFYFTAWKQAQPRRSDVMVCRLTDKEALGAVTASSFTARNVKNGDVSVCCWLAEGRF